MTSFEKFIAKKGLMKNKKQRPNFRKPASRFLGDLHLRTFG